MQKKGKMLVLIGESASGKTTIQKILENYGIKKVVTYTTRPMRAGEVDGVDYHFVDDDTFYRMIQNEEFVEHASYRGWSYGTALKSCGYEDTSIALTPAGLRAIKRNDIPCVSFYINVDRRSRLINLLKRGDDIEEAYRRSLSDVGQFDSIGREVDFDIRNEEYKNPAETIAAFINEVYRAEVDAEPFQ